MWELTVGVGNGIGRGGQRGKNWDNYNRVTIKQKKKEKTLFLHSYHQNFVSFKDANWGNHNSKVNIFKKSFKVVIVAVP